MKSSMISAAQRFIFEMIYSEKFNFVLLINVSTSAAVLSSKREESASSRFFEAFLSRNCSNQLF
jgi:hypothetical protein